MRKLIQIGNHYIYVGKSDKTFEHTLDLLDGIDDFEKAEKILADNNIFYIEAYLVKNEEGKEVFK